MSFGFAALRAMVSVELSLTPRCHSYPPASWTDNIASYIKSLAPNQLILDGTGGFYNYSSQSRSASFVGFLG